MSRNITVTFADGTSHVYQNAPDNLTPQAVTARASKDFGKQVTALDGGKKTAQPQDNSKARGFLGGVLKPFDNATMALRQIPGVGAASDAVADFTGMPRDTAVVQGNQAARKANTRKNYQTLGNIVGTLPTLVLPGGAAVQGAASGALTSDAATPEGVAIDTTLGGLAGKAGQMVFNGASALAKPVVSKAGKALYDAGVPQTIGQIMSGGKSFGAHMISKGEEALTSVPLLGDMIGAARNRGTEGFNIALGNRVLGNIGEKLPATAQAGQDMVDFVGKRLSAKYTALVPKLVGQFDSGFASDLAKAKASTATLPPATQRQFASIVKDVFGNRANGQQISGQALKDAESRLTFLTKKYTKSLDPDQSIMGSALDQVRQSLRSMVARNNPQHAAELQALNKGWAQLGQMRSAANAAGNSTGIITPAQALAAARKNGFPDQFVKDAKTILPNNTPDSGTARRGAMTLAALAGGGGAGAVTVSPFAAIPAAGSLLYTKGGQTLLNKLAFAPRAKAVQQTGVALRKLGTVAPSVIAAAFNGER